VTVGPIEVEHDMGGTEKAKNRAENVRGKLKSAAGRITGNARTEQKGRRKQVKTDLKNAGEKTKDAFKH
jgi:uncharacterized protein YjbJ (UPF0337 family)